MHCKRGHPSSIDAQHEHAEDEETREGRKGNVPTTSTRQQPHIHAKHCTLMQGIDSLVCTTSAATPAIDVQHDIQRDEEAREGGKGKGDEEK
ncbi:hypothetical protein PAXINDRAFT_22305 [Paxillus involutus ATCC 200175]|uniref:Uncharacterized protein n=1 Tax=Paxillus involutus ATCC 200175 TaxID=664439 RepID=A0A0C9SZ81_PAXIN|nr:hypothetical protein PAXINDRAFT_22305 [Paxillus involutus ATCC 200175]